MSFHAVLFDVDDTLFNRRIEFDKWADHYIGNILKVGPSKDRETMLRSIASEAGNGYGSKKELIETFMAAFPPPKVSHYDAETAYAEYFAGTTLAQEAEALLKWLEERRIPYGIVTNGTIRQVEKVERLGLYSRTPCVFVSEAFGSAKPDPAIFLAAAKCLDVAPEKIVFVGDHPINDIFGAHNAGMRTAWLHNDQPWPEELFELQPDIVLDRLEDLLNYFKQ